MVGSGPKGAKMSFLRLFSVATVLFSLPAWAAEPRDRCHIDGAEVAATLEGAGALVPGEAPPLRRSFDDTPTLRAVGEIVLADVAACAAADRSPECAFDLAGKLAGRDVFQYRNHGRELLAQVSGLVGDHVEIPIFFTDFLTTEFPGAFYATFFNDIRGTGLDIVDLRHLLGKDPTRSSLRGLIAMNLWWNCSVGGNYLDPAKCSDHPPFSKSYVTIHGILLHEVGHRWGAGLRFKDPVTGAVSAEMLGRAGSHWSFWLNSEDSPLEGNHWVDEGGGSFRVFFPESTRYSDFDLYAMGLLEASEVGPTFLIRPQGCPGQSHCSGARKPAEQVVTIQGSRVDVTIDDVIAALGARDPSVEESPKITKVAFVLTRLQGGTYSDSFGADEGAAAKLDQVRRDWTGFFYEATRTRARVISTLSGRDDYPRFEFTASSEGWVAFGAKAQAQTVDEAVVLESVSTAEVALVHEEVQLDASEYLSAKVRVAVPPSAKGSKLRLSFGGLEQPASGKPLERKVTADGALHEYSFDLRRSETWTGTVGTIRLALAGAPAGTAFTIDHVSFSDEVVEAPGDGGKKGGEGSGGGCAAAGGSPTALLLALGCSALLLRSRR